MPWAWHSSAPACFKLQNCYWNLKTFQAEHFRTKSCFSFHSFFLWLFVQETLFWCLYVWYLLSLCVGIIILLSWFEGFIVLCLNADFFPFLSLLMIHVESFSWSLVDSSKTTNKHIVIRYQISRTHLENQFTRYRVIVGSCIIWTDY